MEEVKLIIQNIKPHTIAYKKEGNRKKIWCVDIACLLKFGAPLMYAFIQCTWLVFSMAFGITIKRSLILKVTVIATKLQL